MTTPANKLLPDHSPQHSHPKAVAIVGYSDDLRLYLNDEGTGATDSIAQYRFLPGLLVLFDDLLDPSLCDLDSPHNLLCGYILVVLTKDIANSRLV